MSSERFHKDNGVCLQRYFREPVTSIYRDISDGAKASGSRVEMTTVCTVQRRKVTAVSAHTFWTVLVKATAQGESTVSVCGP